MHFANTLIVSVLVTTAAAAPLFKRGAASTLVDELTSVDDPLVDLGVNVVSGLEGGATVLDGVLGQVSESTKKRDAQVADPANPIDDLLVNVEGGLEGGVTVIDGVLGQISKVTKKRDSEVSDPDDPIDDLLVNIGGGLEGGVTVIDGVLGQAAKVTKRSG